MHFSPCLPGSHRFLFFSSLLPFFQYLHSRVGCIGTPLRLSATPKQREEKSADIQGRSSFLWVGKDAIPPPSPPSNADVCRFSAANSRPERTGEIYRTDTGPGPGWDVCVCVWESYLPT
ncbi:hypothetical protein F5Y03DRAFT_71996 [Xylaria venustula]|nr:hypothetical protein F5Y03DRAFT_71996 [Xylaria venustula]